MARGKGDNCDIDIYWSNIEREVEKETKHHKMAMESIKKQIKEKR